MSKKNKIIAGGIVLLALLAVVTNFFHHSDVQVLNPAGEIGEKERNLMYFALGLSLVVVIPVFIMLFSFAYTYREGNKKAKYNPELSGSKLAEAIWWVVPTVLITILAVVAWRSSYSLDPYKELSSNVKPIRIQVVSLDWKWLFIYPDQKIATVNYFEIPQNTPVDFELTSDSVMNSFWIPRLGGQIYCMPGMTSHLHLVAEKTGEFKGSSANISGAGFSDMFFTAKSTTQGEFTDWMAGVKKTRSKLDDGLYAELAKPSRNTPKSEYGSVQEGLFSTIVGKYVVPINEQGAGYIIPMQGGSH
ncbi:MAG TPA: ubiquinol oxidase subunit II [Candidatus Saccharimonadales bacterium]|nr:ubiquinol oxidase subunit II [Candidatus Saccharimonadales bacterium]